MYVPFLRTNWFLDSFLHHMSSSKDNVHTLLHVSLILICVSFRLSCTSMTLSLVNVSQTLSQ